MRLKPQPAPPVGRGAPALRHWTIAAMLLCGLMIFGPFVISLVPGS